MKRQGLQDAQPWARSRPIRRSFFEFSGYVSAVLVVLALLNERLNGSTTKQCQFRPGGRALVTTWPIPL